MMPGTLGVTGIVTTFPEAVAAAVQVYAVPLQVNVSPALIVPVSVVVAVATMVFEPCAVDPLVWNVPVITNPAPGIANDTFPRYCAAMSDYPLRRPSVILLARDHGTG